jgi:hypothetical protein
VNNNIKIAKTKIAIKSFIKLFKILCFVLLMIMVFYSCGRKGPTLYITAAKNKPLCWLNLCIGDKLAMASAADSLMHIEGMQKAAAQGCILDIFYFVWQDPVDSEFHIAGEVEVANDKIERIVLRPPEDHTIGQFIRDFGEPSCVLILDSAQQNKSIDLVFERQGFIVWLDYVSDADYKLITGDMPIAQITLTVPDEAGRWCQSDRFYRVYKWAGYKVQYP